MSFESPSLRAESASTVGRGASAGKLANIGPIQWLRGIAAMMVICLHLGLQCDRLGIGWREVPALAAGVDIFFVISGFIMWVTTATRPDRSSITFVRDRLIRIVPLYWVMTSFIVVTILLFPAVAKTTTFEHLHALKSYFFIPAEHPTTGSYQPILIPGWTLNLEIYFYCLFGLAMFVAGRNLRQRGRLILITLTALFAAGYMFQPEGVLQFYTRSRLIEFAFGIAIGMAFLSGRVSQSALWWLIVVAGAVALLFLGEPLVDAGVPRGLALGVPSAAIVGASVFLPAIRIAPLEAIGDWSYSLYISHPIFLSASVEIWSRWGAQLPSFLYPLMALGSCVVGAALVYRFIEVPLTSRAKALFTGGRTGLGHESRSGEAALRASGISAALPPGRD